jgi:hypothetical protein
MKTPADKAVVYTVAIIVAAIVIYLVIGAVTSRVLVGMMGGPTLTLPAAYPG